MRERADEARRAPFACEREPRELVRRMLVSPLMRAQRILHRPIRSTRRAILPPWLSTRSRMRRLDIGAWSRSVATAVCKRAPSGSRFAILRCSTAKAGDGCSDPRTASGIDVSASAGCRPTLRAASSVHLAGITTWDVIVTASNADSV